MTNKYIRADLALRHTSYLDMCEQFDSLEQAARDMDAENPYDLAAAQFFTANGFHLENAFTVYMVECARKGVVPVLPSLSVSA